MSNLTDLVPPLKLCKKIPAGEFKDSCFVRVKTFEGWVILLRNCVEKNKAYITGAIYPAPTLQEILEELHKQQENVFLKWSEHAYKEWLVNAYTNNEDKVEDYQAHDKNLPTAALRLWLQLSDKSDKSELSDTIESDEKNEC